MSADGRNAVQRSTAHPPATRSPDTDLRVMAATADRMVAKGEPIESIPAWTTRTLRPRGIDLFRSPRSRPVSTTVPTHDGAVEHDLADGGDALAQADAEFDVLLCGSGSVLPGSPTHRGQYRQARDGAHRVVRRRGPRCGLPPSRWVARSEIESAHWVGLWYAGKRDVFPTGRAGRQHAHQTEIAGNYSREGTAACQSVIDDVGGEHVG